MDRPLTRSDVDQQIRQVLDEFVRAPPGAPGLRVLGSGPNDAAAGSGTAEHSVLAAQVFAPRHTPAPVSFADAQAVLAGRIFGSR